MKAKNIFLLTLCLFVYNALSAKVLLPSVISDNMVLQQQALVSFWGSASSKNQIRLSTSWDNKTYLGETDKSGNWKISIHTPSFGGPYHVTITDNESITLKNIMIGDVWFCSGQSNMEMPLAGWGKVNNYQKEIAAAKYPEIRLLQVDHITSRSPLAEASVSAGGWQPCSPQSVPEFSATAYFFAREVYRKTGIPIGLIHSSWGGTVAQAWVSEKSLGSLNAFSAELKRNRKLSRALAENDLDMLDTQWKKEILRKDKGFDKGHYKWVTGNEVEGWKKMNVPSQWETTALPDFDGIVYIQKKIIIPETGVLTSATLSLGKIDDNDITFLDGKIVGSTEGYDNKREYEIGKELLAPGEHTITVRVFDNGGGGGMYGNPTDFFLDLKNGSKIDLSGDWRYKIGLDLKKVGPSPGAGWTNNSPTGLFNAMVNPFKYFAIRGVIWYQGESNAESTQQALLYHKLFPLLIKDWRNNWKNEKLPFIFTQLANYKQRRTEPMESDWAELRSAQFKALRIPNTAMVVTIDIGEASDIHPKNKQDVGKRLGLAALSLVYNLPLESSGPLYRIAKIKSSSIELSFDHAIGIRSEKGPLKGFEIAGKDRHFYPAQAVVDGERVLVSSPQVNEPFYVRYGWGDNPDTNLTNSSGLPASPFQTIP